MSNQNNQTTTNNQTSTRRPRTCSVCKQSGHDKRNCPAAASLAYTPQESRRCPQNISRPSVAQVDMNSCIYCVFDLETTGFSRNYHDIIEICGILLDARGNIINEDISIFHSLVRPSKRISPVITGITGISDDTVATAPSFQEVGRDFIQFLKDNCTFGMGANIEDDDSDDDSDDDGSGTGVVPSLRDIVLVAHNGNRFDVPFLFHSFRSYGIDFHGLPLKGKIDTLDLVKHTIRSNQALRVPENYQLRTLYKYVTGEELSDSHRAESDAKATLQILKSEHFWDKRHDVMKPIIINEHGVYGTPTSATIDMVEDSDTDEGSDLDISDDEEDEDDIVYDNARGGRWRLNTAYVAPDTRQRYNDVFTRVTRGTQNPSPPGLKVNKNSLNSPIKAWSYIFTTSLLNKIVKYTNDYGTSKCSKWNDITVSDLKDFIAVLFLAGIQKRKDKTTNWWSEDDLVNFPIVKRIMSGKMFHTILRYLHVCDMYTQPTLDSPQYSPMYKVKEFMDYVAQRCKLAFEPGPSLSLDETLVRAFGRIKFKVRIVTKAARYGIKIYVLADADTSYILRVLVYTGQYTYNNTITDPEEELSKTVKVCKELCSPYRGSHRVVYVNRFYTSVDLVKELEEMKLYVTGTMMSNRIPSDARINKRSREFQSMDRGDHKRHVYEYKTDSGEESKMILICWKDRDIVYCLTNAWDTDPTGHCYRRSQTGRVCISRPMAIGEYNTKMGGVDLADKIRLHCNSTIHGLHRWWLKLFFYQLDVGTSNAMILCNEAMNTSYNIVAFKKELVKAFVGHKLQDVIPAERPVLQHNLIHGEARRTCVYCETLGTRNRRTRYYCSNPTCLLPLCLINPDKDAHDCFALAHENEEIRSILRLRKVKMERKDNNRPK